MEVNAVFLSCWTKLCRLELTIQILSELILDHQNQFLPKSLKRCRFVKQLHKDGLGGHLPVDAVRIRVSQLAMRQIFTRLPDASRSGRVQRLDFNPCKIHNAGFGET